jgi:hypothetical protein
MNDKDKEEFDKWYSEEYAEILWSHSTGDEVVVITWQAACEYKQKEVDELKNITSWTVEQDGKVTRHLSICDIEKLQAENKKLREALEFYAVNGLAMVEVGMRIDERLTKEFYINGSYAREALKEITTN